MRYKEEEGQALLVVALAMSIFLFLGVGLAVDGSHIYAQRQMAQTAADAAAQAGIMSLFDGTYAAGTAAGFSPTSSFNCTTSDARTPCSYASMNGFGGSSSDTVTVSFPPDTAVSGVNFTKDLIDYPVNLIQVTVQRSVSTTLMRLFGATATTVKATAMAAIVSVVSPVPILVTHPSMAGSFSTNGGVLVTICGGPNQSIQVNSGAGAVIGDSGYANVTKGSGTVDLSHAGPPDPGNCTTGKGATFGTYGGPSTPPFTLLGTYVQPAPPITDPLINVQAPPIPTNTPGTNMGTSAPLADGVMGCPKPSRKNCQLYTPGLYVGGINGDNSTPVFLPGIYYIQGGGMTCHNNCDMYMASGSGVLPDTGPGTTNTGWTGNMLVYNSYPPGQPNKVGPIDIGANGSISLVGSPPSDPNYLGMLFFQDRSSPALSHSMGGGGAMTLQGTIYLTNTLSTMTTNPSQYQSLSLQGNPGSGTLIQGEIIVGALSMGGNASIMMNLSSTSTLTISQVALVN